MGGIMLPQAASHSLHNISVVQHADLHARHVEVFEDRIDLLR